MENRMFQKGERFLVKATKLVPMIDNPYISCGFEVKEVEQVWVTLQSDEFCVVGINPETKEHKAFKLDEITCIKNECCKED